MIPVKTPIPPYAVTDGTYWPDGLGTIPLPVEFPDNGSAYVVITISGASAGDSLDTLTVGGIDILGGPVPMVAGDDDQSADDIVSQVDTTTSGLFDGTVASNGMVVVYRTDGIGNGSGMEYTATTSNGTTINVVQCRWVLQELGNTGDGTYYLMDALDPGNAIPDITTLLSLVPGQWLYLPQFHTIHKVLAFDLAGLGPLSSDWGTHVSLSLHPAPATSPATLYPVVQLPPMIGGLTVRNTGGSAAVLDGFNFAPGGEFDRSIQGQVLYKPVTYDSSGTQLAISTNG
jgi:hypothetical protein